jgi:hypothetical protein
MEKAWEWIKSHPVYVIGGLGVLVLFYVLYSAGSSTSTGAATSATGPTDAEVNAAAAVQTAQIQSKEANDQLTAQLSAQQNNNATQLAIANVAASVQNNTTSAQSAVSLAGISAQQQVQTAGITSQQIIALANDATQAQLASTAADVQKTQIGAVVSIANAPYDAQTAEVQALGPGGLTSVLKGAEGTKNAYVNIGGISAGRNTPASSFNPSTLTGPLAAIAGII